MRLTRPFRTLCAAPGPGLVPALLCSLALLSACVPIPLAERPVDASTISQPVAPGWDASSARDLHLAAAHALKQSLAQASTGIEVIEGDAFWAAADPVGHGSQPMRISEILAPAPRARVAALGIRYLIVPAPLAQTEHRELTPAANPFYTRDRQTTTRAAVLVDLAAPQEAPTRYATVATGESREGWFPGGPLLFARLHSRADTETAALRALGQAIAARLLEPGAATPVRVAILPEP